MELLVTGASGFIGRNFLAKVKEHHITTLSLKNVVIENIDFNSIDTILHLAGLAHQMDGAPEEDYFKINTTLTFNFAKRAKEEGVKHFIFISTAKVYGESTSEGAAFNELSECNPQDPYSKSKLQAEVKLKSLMDENFIVSIVRIPLVYGAGVKGNLRSLTNLIQKTPILPLGKINNKRSLVYVGTLIDYLLKIITLKKSGIFIACDNITLSTSELVDLMAKSLNKKLFLFKMPTILTRIITYFRPQIIDRLYGSFKLDNSNTNKQLNFKHHYSIEDGIKEMVIV